MTRVQDGYLRSRIRVSLVTPLIYGGLVLHYYHFKSQIIDYPRTFDGSTVLASIHAQVTSTFTTGKLKCNLAPTYKNGKVPSVRNRGRFSNCPLV